MSLTRHAGCEADSAADSGQCNCAKSFDASQLQFSSVPGHGYINQMREKAWTCELFHDPELQIGSPLASSTSAEESIQYSPFVLHVGFLGPCGEDDTAFIDNLMPYTRLSFSALHIPQATSGVLLTRDTTSIYIRMACKPSCCPICGKCENCLAQIPAVNTFVENLGTMAFNIYIKQRQFFWTAENRAKPPYPKTAPSAFTELFMRLLRGFHKGGLHDRNVATFQQKFLCTAENQITLIASTYESAPVIGCLYSIDAQSIIPISKSRPCKSDPQCAICLETLATVSLMQMPCDCLRCVDCLGESFRLACSARHNFPPTCCRKILSVHKYAEHLQPDLLSRFIAVADEYMAEDSLYCADPACSAFIRAILIEGNTGICPKCFKRTCVQCKKLESKHTFALKRTCPIEEDETKLKTLAGEQEWKLCPRCGAVVERSDGCNHMKCHCGQYFCYQCGGAYSNEPNCNCGLGLNYLQHEVDNESSESDDDERDHEDEGEVEGNDGGEDVEENVESDIVEDEDDVEQRQRLLQAGVDLVRGDLARIRAEEIQLHEEAHQGREREQEPLPTEDIALLNARNRPHRRVRRRPNARIQWIQRPENAADVEIRRIEDERRRRLRARNVEDEESDLDD